MDGGQFKTKARNPTLHMRSHFYRSQSKSLIHMCVYLADDVVFTKNGGDYLQPWVLMKIPDLVKYYASKSPVRVTVHRPKRF